MAWSRGCQDLMVRPGSLRPTDQLIRGIGVGTPDRRDSPIPHNIIRDEELLDGLRLCGAISERLQVSEIGAGDGPSRSSDRCETVRR